MKASEALETAQTSYENRQRNDEKWREAHLGLLKGEIELFSEAMVLLTAFILAAEEPDGENATQCEASRMLYIVAYNLILACWDATLSGYFNVQPALMRTIRESITKARAVSLSEDLARRWVSGKKIALADARQTVKRKLEEEDKEFARQWEADEKKLTALENQFVHAQRGLLHYSRLFSESGKEGLILGSYSNPITCQREIIELAYESIRACYEAYYSLRNYISDVGELKTRLQKLWDEGNEYLDRRAQEVMKLTGM